MPAPRYVCDTEGSVGLTTTVAKTVVGAKAHANSGLQLVQFSISVDGVTTTAVPLLVEVLYTTWATNAPGTNSTLTTPRQTQGRVLAAGFTAGKTWTAEPTGGLTPVYPSFFLPQLMGSFAYDFPLGTEPDTALAEGFLIRLTATFSGSLNVRAGLTVSRC